jgi:chromodomain-helicase-DNA-binding protein 7
LKTVEIGTLFSWNHFSLIFRNDDDNNSKHGDGEDGEEDASVLTPMRSTSRAESKDNEDRPSSSGKLEFSRKSKQIVMKFVLSGLDDEESIATITNIGGNPTEDAHIWPSMQDLNTRLRRVITAYQRNYKKEELKQQQKAKVSVPVNSVVESILFYCIPLHISVYLFQ